MIPYFGDQARLRKQYSFLHILSQAQLWACQPNAVLSRLPSSRFPRYNGPPICQGDLFPVCCCILLKSIHCFFENLLLTFLQKEKSKQAIPYMREYQNIICGCSHGICTGKV